MVQFRDRHGATVQADALTATEAKNGFGRALEKVIQGGLVVITRHDAPKAVLISIDEYQALSHASELQLDELTAEFDATLDGLQSTRTRAAMKQAFSASPKQLGRAARTAASTAASTAARKRG